MPAIYVPVLSGRHLSIVATSNLEAVFDVLSTTASDLCKRLDAGSINSVQIVETYLAQIAKHNTAGAKCRAVISIPPTTSLISQASRLDKERAEGRVRGPLHGIPMLLKVSNSDCPTQSKSLLKYRKDVFATDISLGMPTTAGSCALMDSRPAGNADVVNDVIASAMMGESN